MIVAMDEGKSKTTEVKVTCQKKKAREMKSQMQRARIRRKRKN